MTTAELQQAVRLHERAQELTKALNSVRLARELRLRVPADGSLGTEHLVCVSLQMGELEGRIERALREELDYVQVGLAKLGVSDE